MSKMGKNVKFTLARPHRAAIAKIFRGPLAAEQVASDDDKDIYRLEDGNVGFFLVEEREALTPEQTRRAPWLEVLVPEPGALRDAMLELGAELVEYTDKTHDYYALPGGQVVRLAPVSRADA